MKLYGDWPGRIRRLDFVTVEAGSKHNTPNEDAARHLVIKAVGAG